MNSEKHYKDTIKASLNYYFEALNESISIEEAKGKVTDDTLSILELFSNQKNNNVKKTVDKSKILGFLESIESISNEKLVRYYISLIKEELNKI